MVKHLDHESVLNILPDRDVNANKGDFGRILLLCGSRGFTGAGAACQCDFVNLSHKYPPKLADNIIIICNNIIIFP